MTRRITEELGEHSYLLLAPTGSAALNVEGNTIHSALHIPIRAAEFSNLSGAEERKFYDDMENVRFLIIDEYSMIGLSLLGMIEQRCAQANPRSKEVQLTHK